MAPVVGFTQPSFAADNLSHAFPRV
eukprot:COSAG06_NODE_49011_length_328_cov_0.882096_1_plen_24_part_01